MDDKYRSTYDITGEKNGFRQRFETLHVLLNLLRNDLDAVLQSGGKPEFAQDDWKVAYVPSGNLSSDEWNNPDISDIDRKSSEYKKDLWNYVLMGLSIQRKTQGDMYLQALEKSENVVLHTTGGLTRISTHRRDGTPNPISSRILSTTVMYENEKRTLERLKLVSPVLYTLAWALDSVLFFTPPGLEVTLLTSFLAKKLKKYQLMREILKNLNTEQIEKISLLPHEQLTAFCGMLSTANENYPHLPNRNLKRALRYLEYFDGKIGVKYYWDMLCKANSAKEEGNGGYYPRKFVGVASNHNPFSRRDITQGIVPRLAGGAILAGKEYIRDPNKKKLINRIF